MVHGGQQLHVGAARVKYLVEFIESKDYKKQDHNLRCL